jgi:hypothetical protein
VNERTFMLRIGVRRCEAVRGALAALAPASARLCVLLSHVPCSKPNQRLRRVPELDGDPPKFGPFFARIRRATAAGSGTSFEEAAAMPQPNTAISHSMPLGECYFAPVVRARAAIG